MRGAALFLKGAANSRFSALGGGGSKKKTYGGNTNISKYMYWAIQIFRNICIGGGNTNISKYLYGGYKYFGGNTNISKYLYCPNTDISKYLYWGNTKNRAIQIFRDTGCPRPRARQFLMALVARGLPYTGYLFFETI